MPNLETANEESAEFEAEVVVHFDPETERILDVDCSVGGDFSVTVLPTDNELK